MARLQVFIDDLTLYRNRRCGAPGLPLAGLTLKAKGGLRATWAMGRHRQTVKIAVWEVGCGCDAGVSLFPQFFIPS